MRSITVPSSKRGLDWEQVFREQAPRIRAFLERRMRRREDAEDLVQETFTRVMRKKAKVQEIERPASYLLATADRLAQNEARAERVRQTSPLDEEIERGLPGGASADRAWRRRQVDDSLREALDRMSEAERRAFTLAVLEQRPYDEVASRLGWSREQVKVYVHRARRRAIGVFGERGVLGPEEFPR